MGELASGDSRSGISGGYDHGRTLSLHRVCNDLSGVGWMFQTYEAPGKIMVIPIRLSVVSVLSTSYPCSIPNCQHHLLAAYVSHITVAIFAAMSYART